MPYVTDYSPSNDFESFKAHVVSVYPTAKLAPVGGRRGDQHRVGKFIIEDSAGKILGAANLDEGHAWMDASSNIFTALQQG